MITKPNSTAATRALLESGTFDYPLPEAAIAKFPLPERDASRLLVWSEGEIVDSHFKLISNHLPANSLVVFNNTKVVPARLFFQKKTGAWIEILVTDHLYAASNQSAKQVCTCIIGNKKKWHPGEILEMRMAIKGETELVLRASLWNESTHEVELSWNKNDLNFLEVLALAGEMPIPPYLNREADETDKTNYQTVYARNHGAIAAPTAGLHFTESVLNSIITKQIQTTEVTLHVGIGTFKPMKTTQVAAHEMHAEEVHIGIETISALEHHTGPLVAVGTTSMRTLESLFWLGLVLKNTGSMPEILETEIPYQLEDTTCQRTDILQILRKYMEDNQLKTIAFATRIYIMPGYRFRMVDGLITNFHQPKSTLLVLIAAFIGNDWKEIYHHALEVGYRFLSYGDSSLLWRSE